MSIDNGSTREFVNDSKNYFLRVTQEEGKEIIKAEKRGVRTWIKANFFDTESYNLANIVAVLDKIDNVDADLMLKVKSKVENYNKKDRPPVTYQQADKLTSKATQIIFKHPEILAEKQQDISAKNKNIGKFLNEENIEGAEKEMVIKAIKYVHAECCDEADYVEFFFDEKRAEKPEEKPIPRINTILEKFKAENPATEVNEREIKDMITARYNVYVRKKWVDPGQFKKISELSSKVIEAMRKDFELEEVSETMPLTNEQNASIKEFVKNQLEPSHEKGIIFPGAKDKNRLPLIDILLPKLQEKYPEDLFDKGEVTQAILKEYMYCEAVAYKEGEGMVGYQYLVSTDFKLYLHLMRDAVKVDFKGSDFSDQKIDDLAKKTLQEVYLQKK